MPQWFRRRLLSRAFALSPILIGAAAFADEPTPLTLDQRILQIEQQLPSLKALQASSTRASGAFSFQSTDSQSTLVFHALVQADGRFYPDAPSALGLVDTFTLRRVEPSLEGTLTPLLSYRLMPEFGGSPTSTVTADVYGELHFHPVYFNLRFGKFKEPVGLENLQSSGNLAFIERGFPTSLIPNRDIGLQMAGAIGNARLSYALGVFNGAPDGADANASAVDNHKRIAARLFTRPWHDGLGGALDNLGFGIGGTWGIETSESLTYASGSNASVLGTNGLLPQYKTPGQNVFFQYGSNASPVGADGVHERLTPQAYYYFGPFSAMAEYVVTHQRLAIFNKPENARLVSNKAQEVTLGYVLTGEKSRYGSVVPNTPYRSSGGWGAWEVVARAGQLTIDRNTFNPFADGAALASLSTAAQQAKAQGFGINWYLNTNLKIQLDYDQTHFNGGAIAGNRPTEHALLGRAQLSF